MSRSEFANFRYGEADCGLSLSRGLSRAAKSWQRGTLALIALSHDHDFSLVELATRRLELLIRLLVH